MTVAHRPESDIHNMIELTRYVAKYQTRDLPPETYYYDPTTDNLYSRHHAALWERLPKKGRISKNWALSTPNGDVCVSSNYLRAQLHDQILTLTQ
jgi:hypothetical protein